MVLRYRIEQLCMQLGASPVALVVQNLPANAGDAGDAGDVGLIPGSRRSPGGRHINTPHYSWVENPMDRGALAGHSSYGGKESHDWSILAQYSKAQVCN